MLHQGDNVTIVRSILERSLHWLHNCLGNFDPYKVSSLPEAGEFIDSPYKPITELAFLCIEWSKKKSKIEDIISNDAATVIYEAMDLINTFINTYDLSSIFWNEPRAFPAFATLLDYTSQVGLPDKGLRVEFERLLKEGYALAMERLPFRYLDLHYTLDRLNCEHNLPDMGTLYAQTAVSQCPPATCLDVVECYAITHTIFYLTAMGERDLEELLAPSRVTALRRLVKNLLVIMLWERDLDLLGEFLICARFMNCNWSHAIESAWQLIADFQRESGAIPRGSYGGQDCNVDNLEWQKYEFIHCYHTTLVIIIAALHWILFTLEDNNV